MVEDYRNTIHGADCQLVENCIPIYEDEVHEEYGDINLSQNSANESSNAGYMDSGLGISVCQGSSCEITYSEDRRRGFGYCLWCYIFIVIVSFIGIIIIIQDYIYRWIQT
ncbi:hypothetical protein WA026_013381 [Henosepilachna vigintioctopunctata]|uniref:Uncharacterized protein n=1 Tax=Henosepilachna vigintioctopunctata TaxID=420089 RepID=A0AAW1VCX9_9CUCU